MRAMTISHSGSRSSVWTGGGTAMLLAFMVVGSMPPAEMVGLMLTNSTFVPLGITTRVEELLHDV